MCGEKSERAIDETHELTRAEKEVAADLMNHHGGELEFWFDQVRRFKASASELVREDTPSDPPLFEVARSDECIWLKDLRPSAPQHGQQTYEESTCEIHLVLSQALQIAKALNLLGQQEVKGLLSNQDGIYRIEIGSGICGLDLHGEN